MRVMLYMSLKDGLPSVLRNKQKDAQRSTMDENKCRVSSSSQKGRA